MSTSPLARDDFDAALVPGFREATKANYTSLDRAWAETSSSVLGPDGEFVAGAGRDRDCPLCGAAGSDSREFFRKLGMRIVSCNRCGLTYSRNVLTDAFDRQLYVESASQTSYQDLKRNEAYANLERVKCRYLVQRVAAWRAPPGRFLDIGPGSGRLLEAAREAGWKALGIEANAEFARQCRSRGVEVLEGFFPDVLPPGERFDVIALLDVIEHLHDPLELLRKAASRLVDGGVVLIQVPNVDSLLVQLEGERNTNFCHGHWSHFNPRTLEKLAHGAGLETLATETIITEIDRIRAFPPVAIAETARRVAGVSPPEGFDAAWLHEHGLGYKAVGYFTKRHA